MAVEPGHPASSGKSNLWVRRVGAALGLALLIAALALAWRQRETVRQALDWIHHLPPRSIAWHATILLGSVMVNLFLSGVLFSLLMSRYGRVGPVEMQALIASATLLNFVPMRPGLLGRVAYHKLYNQIGVTQSAAAVVQAVSLSALAAGYVLAAVVLSLKTSVNIAWLTAAPLAVLGLGAVVWSGARLWVAAAAVRYIDLLFTAARYHAAFALIGSPINLEVSLAFACISVIATMVPFLSNGLGLREWAIGLVAPLLTSYQMTLGITADLVNRAAEMVVVFTFGLIAMAVLTKIQTRRA